MEDEEGLHDVAFRNVHGVDIASRQFQLSSDDEEDFNDGYDDDEDEQGFLSGQRKPPPCSTREKVGFFLFALLSGLSGGIFYAVGAFAADLKALEGYTQTGTNIVAAITYAGGMFPLFFSPFIDDGSTAKRWFVLNRFTWLILTCFLSAGGFLAAALCVVFRPTPLALTVLSFWMFGVGSSLNFCVAIPIAEVNLPSSLFFKFNGVLQTCWALSGLAASLGYRFVPIDSANKLIGILGLACFGWLLTAAIAFVFLRKCPTSSALHRSHIGFWKKLWSGLLLFKSPQFLCQFVSLILAFGVAVNWYNNSEAVTLSLGGTDQLSQSQVTVFFATATFGRLLSSALTSTERLANFQYSSFIFMSISYLLLAAIHLGAYVENTLFEMWIWNAVDGLAYGFLWVLLPIISLHFKPSSVSFEVVYSFFSFGPGIGPLLFDFISGQLYDAAAVEGTDCFGKECYQLYFLVAGLSAVTAFILLVLSHCTPSCQRKPSRELEIEILQLTGYQ